MLILATIALSSCKDDYMDWSNKDSINAEDVPLSLTEKIARYDYLKNYTGIKLGIGADLGLYLNSDTTYSSIVNRNFSDVTIGYDMKHAAMVGSTGSINFTKVDSMLSKLNRNGMTLYGHCLVWHQNNNATYLNSLIAPVLANYITNGDFESGSLTGWSGWGNSSTRAVSANGGGVGGTGYCMVLTNPTDAQKYSAQQGYTLSAPLDQTATYTLTFAVKASVATTLQVEIQNSGDYSADYYGGIAVGTSWTQVTKTITPGSATRQKVIFDFGEHAATYYIDNVSLSKNGAAPNQLTDSQKATIIKGAMEDWISKMMTHYKGKVTAWDVLNEPIDGATDSVRTDYTSTATDMFPWMKYLGKDYGVYAFQFARQYGNGASDKLFINDFGLESDLGKCQGLIDYVKYIESKGTTIDGIGTQMHISITNDTTKIDQMFQMLAATGKLIRISELDIQVNTKSPGATELQKQADMYRYVVNSYKKNIPAAQQYEITVWGVSDNAAEHTNWIPNDAPNLWDANHTRKNAYKGFADGLAGYDVSSKFKGIVYTKN